MKDKTTFGMAITFVIGVFLGISLVVLCGPELALYGNELVCKDIYMRGNS